MRFAMGSCSRCFPSKACPTSWPARRSWRLPPRGCRDGCSTGQMGRIPNNAGGFYVYFAGFAYRIENDEVIRFHWDHLAVNP